MTDWEEVFEELKTELLNEKQDDYILSHMKLHETESQLGYGYVVINSKIVIRQIRRCLLRQIKTGLTEHLTMV